ncbi:GerAB/ArcD/ProY family transporter [Gottfriedia sp. NPDC056225]|uniref:YkvI family membrane protein n=1 Tax=Gottfriedia sp. NPDC056225 TaxID=3345751 RepID=UPI001558802C|nr:GerAB/ArcD/ProY family transporter [Arthrobacter citreus]
MKLNFSKEVRNIAFTYVGTVIGAGFATGKEIVEFFSINGVYGALGILFATILFCWFGSKIMTIAHTYKLKSAQEFNVLLFGELGGNIINALLFFVLIGVTSVMLSGAGAVFKNYLHFNSLIGSFIFIILTFIVLRKGTSGLFSLNNTVVPIMCAFIAAVFINSHLPFTMREINLDNLLPSINTLNISVFTKPITYVCLNMALAQAVLVPIGSECKEKSSIIHGGILGGLILGAILLLIHLNVSGVPNFQQYEIPMVEVIKKIHPIFYYFFLMVILAEIFTTLVGNIYGMSRQINSYIPINANVLVILLLICCLFISIIGYGPLLTFLYPLIGWISFLVILTLLKPKKSS